MLRTLAAATCARVAGAPSRALALPPAARALLAHGFTAPAPAGAASAREAAARAALMAQRCAPLFSAAALPLFATHCAGDEGAKAKKPARKGAAAAGVRAAELPSVPRGDGLEATLARLWNKHSPDAAQAASGLILGFCTGYALKQLGKSLALLVGFSFLGAQCCALAGVAPPAGATLRATWRRFCDANGIADARIRAMRMPSAAAIAAHVRNLAEDNAAAAVGFVPGLVLGFSRG